MLVNDNYKVRRLTPERIPEAFPVVAALDEEITAERWSDYARSILGPDGREAGHGILTLQDRQGCIIGLSAYVIRPDLWRNRVLVIENFAVVALVGAQQAASMLLAAMEQLAREQACQCLAVSLLERKAGKALEQSRDLTGRFFEGAGFRLDLARLSKCFDPTTPDGPGAAGAFGSSKNPGPRP